MYKLVPNIEVSTFFDPDAVRHLCIRENLYTRGNSREYDRMLTKVRQMGYSNEALWMTANDIMNHSNSNMGHGKEALENIMWLLEKYCVSRSFEIVEEEEDC